MIFKKMYNQSHSQSRKNTIINQDNLSCITIMLGTSKFLTAL